MAVTLQGRWLVIRRIGKGDRLQSEPTGTVNRKCENVGQKWSSYSNKRCGHGESLFLPPQFLHFLLTIPIGM